MKPNKKFLFFLLSLVVLVSTLAIAAFAADGADGVLTVEYQDGTVQTYNAGDEIVPPAVPADFAVVDENGKAYKYTVTGSAWEGLPDAVTEDLLGKTVKATVAGTKGSEQVYSVIDISLPEMNYYKWISGNDAGTVVFVKAGESYVNSDGTTVQTVKRVAGKYTVYFYDEASLVTFFKTSCKIHLGGVDLTYQDLRTGSSTRIETTLYADHSITNMFIWNSSDYDRANTLDKTGQSSACTGGVAKVYFDLNGHTVTNTSTNVMEMKGLDLFLYSSIPGAKWDHSAATGNAFYVSDDNTLYIGNEYAGGKYADNLSVYCKSLFHAHWGYGAQILGGKYYQTEGATTGLVSIRRRVYAIMDASFFPIEGQSPLFISGAIDGDFLKNSNKTLSNCYFYAPSPVSIFKGETGTVTFTVDNCTMVNVIPKTSVDGTTITYNATNNILATSEENLFLVAATAPADTVKYAVEAVIPVATGDEIDTDLVGYAPETNVLNVNYVAAGVQKSYLVGFKFVPIPLENSYFEVTVDFEVGGINSPIAWGGIPADENGAITESGTVTAAPADNYLYMAYALYDTVENAVVSFAPLNDASVAEALAEALANQTNAATLYVYQDITAPALSIVKDVAVDLTGRVLTLGGMLTVADGASLTVKGGEILSAKATPFTVDGSLSLSDGAKIYLSSASLVVAGEGTVVISDSCIYNLASASMTMNAVVTVRDAKLMGVSLGSLVTVGGTVLGTAGTFDANAFDDDVTTGLFINNNTESITVLGQSYDISYVEAATNDASKIVTISYVYEDVEWGTHNYYYGSIPSFNKTLVDGYYFEYVGVSALTESVTVECSFHADASKLKAQVTLTDALNYIYYLQVEDAGVLQNLTLNGKALDLASLAKTEFEGKSYYVIPVAFDTFADALDNYDLAVDLVTADETLTVKASVALHDYLGTLLATSEETTAQKAYAVAGYVSALVSHFDYTFAFGDVRMKNLGRINNLLADYEEYKVEPALPKETEISSAYVSSVLLVADEKVTFAFRVANDFAGTVEIGGKAVELSMPFEGFDRTYATTVVSLADLGEEITLTVKDAEGVVLETLIYSLEDYVSGVTTQNEGTAGAYAKALWNLASVLG